MTRDQSIKRKRAEFLFKLLVICVHMFMPVRVYVNAGCRTMESPEKGFLSPGTGGIDDCKPQHGSWDPNPGSLQELNN